MDNNLPFKDLKETDVGFIVSTNGSNIVGCIGLEKRGSDGLIRSFAVADSYKSVGIGKALFESLLKMAVLQKVETLHLLTTTAERYFSKLGFLIRHRNEAPESIRLTKEFSEICPSGSTYMVQSVDLL